MRGAIDFVVQRTALIALFNYLFLAYGPALLQDCNQEPQLEKKCILFSADNLRQHRFFAKHLPTCGNTKDCKPREGSFVANAHIYCVKSFISTLGNNSKTPTHVSSRSSILPRFAPHLFAGISVDFQHQLIRISLYEPPFE